jgi:hypothetical protein
MVNQVRNIIAEYNDTINLLLFPVAPPWQSGTNKIVGALLYILQQKNCFIKLTSRKQLVEKITRY